MTRISTVLLSVSFPKESEMIASAARERGEQARPKIVVVQNWFEELKRLVPAN